MFTPNSHYNEQSIWSSIARNQTLITSASSLVKGMGWYLLCTAFFFPISRLHPHLPLFPLQACLCCTLPLPSTAPPSWSHLETEQVLWRDRGKAKKGISTQANDACSFLSFTILKLFPCSSQAEARQEQEIPQKLRRAVDGLLQMRVRLFPVYVK